MLTRVDAIQSIQFELTVSVAAVADDSLFKKKKKSFEMLKTLRVHARQYYLLILYNCCTSFELKLKIEA